MGVGDGSDTTMLSYQEIANRLGIDLRSARRRVLRSGWARTAGNDGRARVAVPLSVLPVGAVIGTPVGPNVATDDSTDTLPDGDMTRPPVPPAVMLTREDMDRLLSQAETAQAMLREQL